MSKPPEEMLNSALIVVGCILCGIVLIAVTLIARACGVQP